MEKFMLKKSVLSLCLFGGGEVVWGLSSEWEGRNKESSAVLSGGASQTVILKRDSSLPTSRGNNFKLYDFIYSTSGTGSSSLTLQKDPNMPSTSTKRDMQLYVKGTVEARSNSHLTLQLDSKGIDGGLLIHGGSLYANGGTITIKSVKIISVADTSGGQIRIGNSGKVEISDVDRFRMDSENRAGILNEGGEFILHGNLDNYLSSSTSRSYVGSGFVYHKSGTTTIKGDVNNTGSKTFGGSSNVDHSKIRVENGVFRVEGNFLNGGGKNTTDGTYARGILEITGGRVEITGNLQSRIDSPDPNHAHSQIVLSGSAILTANSIENKAGSDITLSNASQINTTTSFTSDGLVHFVGEGSGFGKISGGSIALAGEERYSITSAFAPTANLRYLIIEGTSVSGVSEGAITLLDASGSPADRYKAKLEKETNQGEKYYITLEKIGGSTGGGGGSGGGSTGGGSGGNTGSGGGNGGNTGGGGNTGNGGGSTGGGDDSSEGGNDNPTPPKSDKDIISSALDSRYLILTQKDLDQATETIKSQIDSLQSKSRFLDVSMHFWTVSMHQAPTQALTKVELAYDSTLSPFSPQQDIPTPLFEEKRDEIFVNALVGYEGDGEGGGLSYGLNAGYNHRGESGVFGVYGLIKKTGYGSTLSSSDSLQWEVGAYGRVFLPQEWEMDILGFYSNTHTSYNRDFSINSTLQKQDGAYGLENIDLHLRLGHRFELEDGNSLKPYFGVALDYYISPAYSESGELPLYRHHYEGLGGYGIAGLEYRKYFLRSSLFFATEVVAGSSLCGSDYRVRLGENPQNTITYDRGLDLMLNAFVGADFALTESLDLNVFIKTQYAYPSSYMVDGNVGLRFLF